MKDIEQNTALPLFESDIYKGNIPEDSKDYNYSESTSTKVEEKPPMPEEIVPNVKTEGNLRKKGRFPVYRKMHINYTLRSHLRKQYLCGSW